MNLIIGVVFFNPKSGRRSGWRRIGCEPKGGLRFCFFSQTGCRHFFKFQLRPLVQVFFFFYFWNVWSIESGFWNFPPWFEIRVSRPAEYFRGKFNLCFAHVSYQFLSYYQSLLSSFRKRKIERKQPDCPLCLRPLPIKICAIFDEIIFLLLLSRVENLRSSLFVHKRPLKRLNILVVEFEIL